MDALLLRALPVAEPDRLVVFNWHARADRRDFVAHSVHGSTWGDTRAGETSGMFPYPAFELFRKNEAVFSNVFGYFFQSALAKHLNLAVRGQADLASVHYVSGDYFRGLGMPPAAGRLLVGDDDRAGAPPVAVASYALSERRFGGPARAVGQSDPDRQPALYGCRRDAAGILRRRPRVRSGCLSSDACQPAHRGTTVPGPERTIGSK